MVQGEDLRRLSFTRLMARWLGKPRAQDLQEAFGLSAAQAYRVLRAAGDVTGIDTGEARTMLDLLRGQSLSDGLQPGLGLNFGVLVEDVDTLTVPPVPDTIAAEVLRALHPPKAALSIAYIGRKGTSERVISPTRLVHVYNRYHLRAWDHGARGYRDFVLSRIVEAKITKDLRVAPHDEEWHMTATLRFVINPDLPVSLRAMLAAEWDVFDEGIREIRTRKAHARYVVRRMTERITMGTRRWLPWDEATSQIFDAIEMDVER